MTRQKRPSVALDPRIKARARELRSAGLSYTEVVARLDGEKMRASRAAVWAACQDEPSAAPLVGSDLTNVTRSLTGATPADSADPEDVDVQERADDLRTIAAEAALEVREVTRFVRARRAEGAVTLDDAAKLMSIAERAEKLARVIEGRTASARAAPAASATVNLVLTAQEKSLLDALDEPG